MSKPPSLKPKELVKLLEEKGFVLDRIKGSHYIYINHTSKTRVVIPFHTKELPRGTLLEILKQAGIDRDYFN